MTCPFLLRRPHLAAAVLDGTAGRRAEHVREVLRRAGARLSRDDAKAQFARFVLVGGISSTLYVLLFLTLEFLGDQPANLVGAATSSVVANELHRRLTFHAGQRISWFAAQWEGGGTALVGMVATSLALGWLEVVTGGADVAVRLALIGVVTGSIGLLRFVALRWLFRPRAPQHA